MTLMRQAVLSLTALLFLIWILPLGIFIAPSKEKIGCNGQRAFCMCSHMTTKQQQNDAGKTVYKGSSDSQKEQNGAGGSSHYFLPAQKKDQDYLQFSLYDQKQSLLYSLLSARPIEHVPKV